MSRYPRIPYEIGRDSSVLQCGRETDKTVAVKPQLPGNVIVIHGVNDVGVSYDQVEQGLCAGLGERLAWGPLFQGADYRMPGKADLAQLEKDPDAVFFKRSVREGQHTPVIPFYWGFREVGEKAKNGSLFPHGQNLDRYGNRLDKDFSKGGGPFSNATSTLADMWNRGFGGGPLRAVDRLSADPLRPVLNGPGRMYMVLAARRLAALVAMIRDYDQDDAVSLVAHSQGCMLSLLAQAFLLQQGLRPADTLVLTHPPYSLVDDIPLVNDLAGVFSGGADAAMEPHYRHVNDLQTLHARLQTLANIVQGVAAARHQAPAFESLNDPRHAGMVGCRWQPGRDRDNRGKVYLYFCPEDMTVALDNVQGIGWQGVPEFIHGSRVRTVEKKDALGFTRKEDVAQAEERRPLLELGKWFFQRVFTARLRVPPSGKGAAAPVLVGDKAPYDFALRVEGEDDHAHVAEGAAKLRAENPESAWPVRTTYLGFIPKPEAAQRLGLRVINGEALPKAVPADMHAGALTLPGQPKGAHEKVDPIDAAISVTSAYGLNDLWALMDDDPALKSLPALGQPSPHPKLHADEVVIDGSRMAMVDAKVNAGKTRPSQRRQVQSVFRCLRRASPHDLPRPTGQLLVLMKESPDEARLRQQMSGTSPRSFHGAIFGSARNHQNVTAYDIAIGGGKAVSDPNFYAYLCAVADWRLREPQGKKDVRPGIMVWKKFLGQFSVYYDQEPDWRKDLIYGNCHYYSTGELPKCLPLLPEGLPPTVVCETMNGRRIMPAPPPKAKKTAQAEPETIGGWLARNPVPKDEGPSA